MKLSFDKKADGEVFVQIGGKDFSTKDYIKMVKEIRKKEKIEANYSDQITQEERDSVEKMLKELNNIGEKKDEAKEDTTISSEVNPDDIPF